MQLGQGKKGKEKRKDEDEVHIGMPLQRECVKQLRDAHSKCSDSTCKLDYCKVDCDSNHMLLTTSMFYHWGLHMVCSL